MLDSATTLQTVNRRLSLLEEQLRQLRQSSAGAQRAEVPPATTAHHPYVTRVDAILNGEPIITGTRTPVRAVVEHWKFGAAPEEIVRELPHLRLAHVFDALGYYDDHRAEIERYIALNRIPVDD
jgi:uncharacterized protein (DUF433 family)